SCPRQDRSCSCRFTSKALLPARLDHARDLSGERELAEADAAHLELAEVAAGPPAPAAARVLADRELRLPLGLGNEGQLGHLDSPYWFRNGMPRYCRRSFDSSSVLAVVWKVTFMPRSLSTFA